jgi:hypothetical protein
MNSYARPDVRYCRAFLHSKCKQGSFGILEARLLTSQVKRLTGGSARDVNNKGQQNDKKRDCILNVKRPVGISHLVVHMRFFA